MIPNIIFPADLQNDFWSSCAVLKSGLFYTISNEVKNNNEASIYALFVSQFTQSIADTKMWGAWDLIIFSSPDVPWLAGKSAATQMKRNKPNSSSHLEQS